jgi:hypothetical protein
MNDRRRRRPGRRQPGSNQRTDEGQIDGKAGEVWHLPNDPHTRTTCQLVEVIYRLAGQPRTKLRSTPALLLRALGVVNPTVRELLELQYEFQEPFSSTAARSPPSSTSTPPGRAGPGRHRRQLPPHHQLGAACDVTRTNPIAYLR